MKKSFKILFALLLALVVAFTSSVPNTVEAAAAKPAKVTIKSVSRSTNNKTITIKYKKVSKATGYQIAYKKTSAKKYSIKTTKKTTCKLSVKANVSYKLKVRAYRKSGKKTVYSNWVTLSTIKKLPKNHNSTSSTGHPSVGRSSKHLLSGILKCPMCGSAMYSDTVVWTNKNGERRVRRKYQCGHYAKAKNGQCKKNTILADWIETEVIQYTKLLVNNEQFAEDVKKQIGQKMDVSEIDAEIAGYKKSLKKLERSKANLEHDIDNIASDDKNAVRKRNDMNKRLDKIYEEIYSIEDQIEGCEMKKASVEQDALTQENVYKLLLVFDKFFDKMNKDDQRRLIEAMISEVHLHPKETWKDGGNPIKEIKYTFLASNDAMETLRENSPSVETVVALRRTNM